MRLAHSFNSEEWHNFLEQKALEVKLTRCETSVFITRFTKDNWLDKIEDVWAKSIVNSCEAFVVHSRRIYKAFKPYCPELSKGTDEKKFPIVRDWLLEEFASQTNNYLPPTEFSLVRSKIAKECYQAILQPGALIRIKAPSKMGKSRLLNNILSFSEQQNYFTVHINLLQIEQSKFDDLDLFLRWFCIYISDALKLNLNLDEYWHKDRGSMLSCTRYLETILTQCDRPLVLGLDEVDRLLNYPHISQDFFYLLRSWHEEANNDDLWEQLRLAVVYSTEDFGSLDINQSPFNVGLPIELQSFSRQEIEELAKVYHLNFSDRDLEQLMSMVAGHPYLTDQAMSYLANHQEINLSQLLQQATTDTGIYNSYLRQHLEHLINLKSNSQLTEIFLQILDSPKPVQVDTLLGYQLYRMGLIKWSPNNLVEPSCELFRMYFLERLKTSE